MYNNSSGQESDNANKQDYTYCQMCAWNGFPNVKIVIDFNGLSPEEEDGFVYKFTEYNYDPSSNNKVEHIHKHKQELSCKLESDDILDNNDKYQHHHHLMIETKRNQIGAAK